jgi:hypothetical protein
MISVKDWFCLAVPSRATAGPAPPATSVDSITAVHRYHLGMLDAERTVAMLQLGAVQHWHEACYDTPELTLLRAGFYLRRRFGQWTAKRVVPHLGSVVAYRFDNDEDSIQRQLWDLAVTVESLVEVASFPVYRIATASPDVCLEAALLCDNSWHVLLRVGVPESSATTIGLVEALVSALQPAASGELSLRPVNSSLFEALATRNTAAEAYLRQRGWWCPSEHIKRLPRALIAHVAKAPQERHVAVPGQSAVVPPLPASSPPLSQEEFDTMIAEGKTAYAKMMEMRQAGTLDRQHWAMVSASGEVELFDSHQQAIDASQARRGHGVAISSPKTGRRSLTDVHSNEVLAL